MELLKANGFARVAECSLSGLAMLVAGMGSLETEEPAIMNEVQMWILHRDRWSQVSCSASLPFAEGCLGGTFFGRMEKGT